MQNKSTIIAGAVLGILALCGIIVCITIFVINHYHTSTPTKPDETAVKYKETIKRISHANYWEYLKSKTGEGVTENSEEIAYNGENTSPDAIRRCGGISAYAYYLVTNNGEELRTRQDLLSFLGEINSPDEAIAYMYAISCNIKNSFDKEEQFVNVVNDGYLVSTLYYPRFGCGIHAHHRIEFVVQPNGDYKELKYIRLEDGVNMCVD